ncbi:LOW QUALITY PROTEIN: hypothetical protein LZ30DRAFT_754395 [Colletotrichum cereale]|nr:LOW QUALITY PROTEIN: hypothetical protein LZ30DRAFT_754395 [Colletotrichum cereale]
MVARQDSDNLAWDRSDELWDEAIRQVRLSSQFESFAESILGEPAKLVTPLIIGGTSVSVLVRLPFLQHGVDPSIGPFMIIQDLGSRRTMGQALEAYCEDPNETAVLNPDISESKLKDIYLKMSRCVLQLAQPSFLHKWYVHNDIISLEDDCRTKYLLHFGFAEDSWSTCSKDARAVLPIPDGLSSFRLWCDDFRPANVVINEDENVLGAIDWEFAYAGPTQFVLDPPWWLLLDLPETWDDGIEDWACVYERRLRTWLLALEEAEKEMSSGSFLLSAYMRESWETRRFWLNYAARKSWAFDTIYWKYLDERFFSECGNNVPTEERWKTRVHLLSPKEQAAMELLVQIKMEESKERVLVEWDAVDARQRLSSFLFD